MSDQVREEHHHMNLTERGVEEVKRIMAPLLGRLDLEEEERLELGAALFHTFTAGVRLGTADQAAWLHERFGINIFLHFEWDENLTADDLADEPPV